MINVFQKADDPFVEYEEIFNLIKNCIFYPRDIRRLSDIAKMYMTNNIKNGKIQKNLFLSFLEENEEIQDIFQRNFHNSDDVDSAFEEEIGIICSNNLKKSKLLNFEDLNNCEQMNLKLEKIIDLIINVSDFINSFVIQNSF